MTQLDQVTQQNAAASQQAASAAEQLSGQAESLRGSVIDLEAAIHGKGNAKSTSSGSSGGAKKTKKKAVVPSQVAAPAPMTNGHVARKSNVPNGENPGFNEAA
jgi:methyl-accepting chemotaxis protein